MNAPAAHHPSGAASADADHVRALADELGFALCGIAPAAASDYADFVRQWLAAGRHGEMHYLANHIDMRLNPAALLPNARSVIVVADFYPSQPVAERQPPVDRPRGRVARYAWGDDYHKVVKKRLHQLTDALRERHSEAAFRATVDTAPLLEREHAARAGLGWTGKHTLLIHPRLGSYMLLGAIVTTLELPTTSADGEQPATRPAAAMTDHCGTCTRCIDACPTQCIANPAAPESEGHRTLDATRCISYLTLEHRSLIHPDLHPAMGDWLAGCDVCQEVCPYNQPIRTAVEEGSGQPSAVSHPSMVVSNQKSDVKRSVHPRYTPRPELAAGLDLLDVLNWSADDRQRVFQGSALKRMKLEMVKRNAIIAAGNALREAEHPALQGRIEQLANDADEHPLVRDTARQVLKHLPPSRESNI